MKRFVCMMAMAATPALAQQGASVTEYIQQGYQVIHSEVGGQFLVFVLKKDNGNALVYCTVAMQTGETASCRTVK